MSSPYTCECGERVDPKGTPHDCPGTPSERIEELEERVRELRLIVKFLAGHALTVAERVAAQEALDSF